MFKESFIIHVLKCQEWFGGAHHPLHIAMDHADDFAVNAA